MQLALEQQGDGLKIGQEALSLEVFLASLRSHHPFEPLEKVATEAKKHPKYEKNDAKPPKNARKQRREALAAAPKGSHTWKAPTGARKRSETPEIPPPRLF